MLNLNESYSNYWNWNQSQVSWLSDCIFSLRLWSVQWTGPPVISREPGLPSHNLKRRSRKNKLSEFLCVILLETTLVQDCDHETDILLGYVNSWFYFPFTRQHKLILDPIAGECGCFNILNWFDRQAKGHWLFQIYLLFRWNNFFFHIFIHSDLIFFLQIGWRPSNARDADREAKSRDRILAVCGGESRENGRDYERGGNATERHRDGTETTPRSHVP